MSDPREDMRDAITVLLCLGVMLLCIAAAVFHLIQGNWGRSLVLALLAGGIGVYAIHLIGKRLESHR